MNVPALRSPEPLLTSNATKALIWAAGGGGIAVLAVLAARDFATPNPLFHPHGFCYLWQPGIVAAHVTTDALIFLSYLTISLTLLYLVRQARRQIPFSWMFLAFGAFIVACGLTHAMEIVTLWRPVYWLSADVKIVTAVASVLTAVVLPPLVPRILGMVEAASMSETHRLALERANDELIADVAERRRLQDRLETSLKEKELLLKEVHHRVKNNLAVISSLFYLQSTYTKDESLIRILDDCQRRVRSMALVHEKLYGSESLAAIDFGEYARSLVMELLATYDSGRHRLELNVPDRINLSIELAVPCGLILSELVSNAFKHAFPGERTGTVVVTVRAAEAGQCVLQVVDDGVGVSSHVSLDSRESLGLRVVQSLVRQIRATFELIPLSAGTEARLTFATDGHARED